MRNDVRTSFLQLLSLLETPKLEPPDRPNKVEQKSRKPVAFTCKVGRHFPGGGIDFSLLAMVVVADDRRSLTRDGLIYLIMQQTCNYNSIDSSQMKRLTVFGLIILPGSDFGALLEAHSGGRRARRRARPANYATHGN